MFTFTCGFDLTNVNGIEQGFDERKNAEKLSYLLQTEHYDVVLHAGDMPAAMEKISWHMDDPRVGMCHQNWYAAKLASRFVKVCLSGTGGDELFGGYPWRYARFLKQKYDDLDYSLFSYWHRLLPEVELPGIFSPDIKKSSAKTRDSFSSLMNAAPAYVEYLSERENILQKIFYFEFNSFLRGLLITEDRISMAHSLEARVPFLDNSLASLAINLSPSLKVDLEKSACNGHLNYSAKEGKLILRKAMEKFLPIEFTKQHKQGFSPPDENWFRGPSMDYIKDILLSKTALSRPWFDKKQIKTRLQEHFTGERNHRLLIWSLLSFEWLQRHYVD
jgi:asparagine synthase (glutamine-hydrolysing)